MQLSLSAEVQKEIDARVKSGQYQKAEDVIAAAVFTLAQQERLGDFGAGELDALLEEAAKAIEQRQVMEADAAFAELRRRHDLRHG